MPRNRSRKGFTLIELLVVIAIIAILAAILFPVFAQARDKARQAACMSNCKQLGTAMQMYSTDYDDQLPGWDDPSAHPLSRTWGWAIVVPLLDAYVKNTNVWSCPSGPHTRAYLVGPKGQQIIGNYGYNEYIYNTKHHQAPFYSGRWNNLAALAGTQAGVSNIAVMADCSFPTIFNDWTNFDNSQAKGDDKSFGIERIKYSNGWTVNGAPGPPRHTDYGANVVFADSHAKFVQGSRLRGSFDANPHAQRADTGGVIEWPVVNPLNIPPP